MPVSSVGRKVKTRKKTFAQGRRQPVKTKQDLLDGMFGWVDDWPDPDPTHHTHGNSWRLMKKDKGHKKLPLKMLRTPRAAGASKLTSLKNGKVSDAKTILSKKERPPVDLPQLRARL